MSGHRWFGMHPVLFIWLGVIASRRVVPWVVDNFEIVMPITIIAALLYGLTWAVFRKVPNPATRKPEIAFVESPPRLGPVALREGARCLVCRDPLSGDVIYCGQCHTPHHRACFTYVGGCSVYACASRKAA